MKSVGPSGGHGTPIRPLCLIGRGTTIRAANNRLPRGQQAIVRETSTLLLELTWYPSSSA